jgi:hypothetical protein
MKRFLSIILCFSYLFTSVAGAVDAKQYDPLDAPFYDQLDTAGGACTTTASITPTTSPDTTTPTATSTLGVIKGQFYNGELTLPSEWIPILKAAGDTVGVDPAFLATILGNETSWKPPQRWIDNPNADSATYSSGTISGPFQFLDSTANSFKNNQLLDGNKDGVIDERNPIDAAYLAAAYLKSMGASMSTPLGDPGDYAVAPENSDGKVTIRTLAAHYNQGGNWGSNKPVQGKNDVNKYMDQAMNNVDTLRKSGVFGTAASSTSGGCTTKSSGGSGLVDSSGYSFPKGPQQKPVAGIAAGQKFPNGHAGGAAFDLMSKYGNKGGDPVYAISDGTIEGVGTNEVGWCYQIQFHSVDTYFYWYGHLNNVTVKAGDQVKAGQQIAEVAEWTSEHQCPYPKTGKGSSGAAHLHIDRGCVTEQGPQHGGDDPCRDHDFIEFLSGLYEKLP